MLKALWFAFQGSNEWVQDQGEQWFSTVEENLKCPELHSFYMGKKKRNLVEFPAIWEQS